MKKLVLLLITACLVFCPAGAVASNPFLVGPEKEEKKVVQETNKPVLYPAALQKAFKPLAKAQRKLHQKMSGFTRTLKNDPSIATLLLLFAVAFSYGVIHALGPGHGKAFAVSYFISGKSEVKKGAFLGFLIALMHAGTSIALVLILYGVVSTTVLNHVENTTRTISLFSYALITLIGMTLLFLRIKNRGHHCLHDHSHDDDPGAGSNKSLISVALAAGIVPCPGTVLLLIFSMSLDMLLLGILLALTIAVGMGVTISLAGMAAIVSRQLLLDIVFKTKQLRLVLTNGLEFAGSAAIVLLGGTLFLSSL